MSYISSELALVDILMTQGCTQIKICFKWNSQDASLINHIFCCHLNLNVKKGTETSSDFCSLDRTDLARLLRRAKRSRTFWLQNDPYPVSVAGNTHNKCRWRKKQKNWDFVFYLSFLLNKPFLRCRFTMIYRSPFTRNPPTLFLWLHYCVFFISITRQKWICN